MMGSTLAANREPFCPLIKHLEQPMPANLSIWWLCVPPTTSDVPDVVDVKGTPDFLSALNVSGTFEAVAPVSELITGRCFRLFSIEACTEAWDDLILYEAEDSKLGKNGHFMNRNL